MDTFSGKLPLYYFSESAVCGRRCVKIEDIQKYLRAWSSIQFILFEGSYVLWSDASRQMKLLYNDTEILPVQKMTMYFVL